MFSEEILGVLLDFDGIFLKESLLVPHCFLQQGEILKIPPKPSKTPMISSENVENDKYKCFLSP